MPFVQPFAERAWRHGEMRLKIGFVGLGSMGQPMAARLLAAGHELKVWNRSVEKASDLIRQGATAAATPAQAAEGVDLVFTMVADDKAAEAVTLGPDGIADGLAAGAIHVSSSTLSVALAQRLEAEHQKREQVFVSATVLGRPPAIALGHLYVIAAGPAHAVERIEPVLNALGQKLFRVGEDAWKANLVKLCANFMIFSTIEQLAEVFAVSEKAGVPKATLFEMLSNSFCSAPVHLNYGKLMVDQNFSPPGGAMSLGQKDTDLFLAAGEAFGAALPMASLLRDRFITSMARGDADLDFAALSNRAREDAGLP